MFSKKLNEPSFLPFAFVMTIVLAPSFAFAQSAGTGTITGTLTDQTGAIVPGATVIVRNTGTGIDHPETSNDAGIYTAPFLQPGTYEITITKTGFAKVVQKNIGLQVGQIVSVSFSLPLQTTQSEVTVTGLESVIDPEKTEQSQVVSKTMIENLPIINGRWDNFVLLTPGVTTDGGLVSYRGISGLYNNNTVDGANNNQAFFSEARGRSTVPYTYSLDSLQEFQVSASNYSAEFGQAAGGIVNAVTKSGGNAIHGDLFYYLRYPSFNALDSFNKSQGVYSQAIHQQQRFGGSVGGPIIKDKLFYFFTYDGSRKVFPITYTSSSGSILPLPCPAAVTASQCTAANNFVKSLITSYPRTGVSDLAFGKLDYQANAANHLSANFDFVDFHAPNAYSPNATYNNNSVTANGPAVTHERFFIANWDSTFKPTVVNNFRFQWGVDNEIIGNNAPGPNVSIASVTAYGMPNALPRPAFPDEHRLQFADTLSWSHGKHTIKAGVDVNVIHELLVNLFLGGGVYSYTGSAQAAFSNWVADVYGVNLGDGLTGRHFASLQQVTDPITGVGKDDFYNNDVAAFVEDSWKPRSNLTVNLGLRYDIQLVPQPPRPNTATPLTQLYTTTLNIDKNNFAPRLGIAWSPTKSTVIRAGYGMFYGKTSNSTYYALRVENGVYQQTFTCTPTSCPSLTFPNVIFTPPGGTPVAPFPGALTPQVTSFTPPSTTQLSHGMVPDFVNPLVHEGEFTIEQQLPGSFSLSAGWLFSRGLHLPVFVDANLAPATQTHTYAILNSSGGLAQTITVPWYTQRLNTNTGVILNGYSIANSIYNALVVTLRRPMSHGFEGLINYTWSHSQDDGAVAGANGTFYGTDWPLDPQNQRAEYSSSDLDQRQRFVASLVYNPRFNISNKTSSYIANGWFFSTIVTVATGQPVFAQISGFPSGGVDSGVTGGEVTNSGGTTGGRPPQFGRNAYYAPGLTNVDFRIMRNFAITERLHLQLLGEAFNIFNHTNISSVNGTAFNFSATCTAAPAGTSGCLVPNAAFLAPTGSTSNNGLYASRQLQISGKITF